MLISAFEFAKQSLEIHDKIPLLCIYGLEQRLFSAPTGRDSIAFTLTGERNASGRPGLRLNISGKLLLVCQRCLGPLEYKLAGENWFELVSTEADLPEDEADNEVDYLVASDELDVEALVKEEILLLMPLAPKHEDGRCNSPLDEAAGRKDNPFRVLEGLKGKKPE